MVQSSDGRPPRHSRKEEDMSILFIGAAALALGLGVWIGIGAPGWPHKESHERRHTSQRNLNPIAWGRTSNRERQRVRDRDERKPRLRRR
jgi:hypothetical protein